MTSPMLRRIRRSEAIATVKVIAGDVLGLLGLAAILTALALLSGCGGYEEREVLPPCDFIAPRTMLCVTIDDEVAEPARSAITPERVDAIAEGTATFYDLPIERLFGWRVAFVGPAPFACGATQSAGGCAEWGKRQVTVSVFMPWNDCIPLYVPLVHEFLHVLAYDFDHDGEHWIALNDARFEVARADPLCEEIAP